MAESKRSSTMRYEREISPTDYDLFKKNGLKVYHFMTVSQPAQADTFGALPGNTGNYLKDIKSGDSLILKVGELRRKELGLKGVEYGDDLEFVVSSVDRSRQDTVYVHLR